MFLLFRNIVQNIWKREWRIHLNYLHVFGPLILNIFKGKEFGRVTFVCVAQTVYRWQFCVKTTANFMFRKISAIFWLQACYILEKYINTLTYIIIISISGSSSSSGSSETKHFMFHSTQPIFTKIILTLHSVRIILVNIGCVERNIKWFILFYIHNVMDRMKFCSIEVAILQTV